ncbi:MAG: hypothetical protein ACLP9L_19560, partial [Thermoguttaceae bacterium]
PSTVRRVMYYTIKGLFWTAAGAASGVVLGLLPGGCVVLGASDGCSESVTVNILGFTAYEGICPPGGHEAVAWACGCSWLILLVVVGAALGAGVAAAVNTGRAPTEANPANSSPWSLPVAAFLAVTAMSLLEFNSRHAQEQSGRPYSVARGGGPDVLKVLFIGNSMTYCHDLPAMFAALSRAANHGREPKVVQVVGGGLSLEDHWRNGKARQAIRDLGPWDYVVLQEQSYRAYYAWEEMFRYARLFDGEIRKAGARTVLFVRPAGQDEPEAQTLLDEGCDRLAKELAAIVAPCGTAWGAARQQHPDLILHDPDRGHPGPNGAYLSACVFYAVLYGKSPEGLPCKLVRRSLLRKKDVWVDVPSDLAESLQRTAWRTVEQAGRRPRGGNRHQLAAGPLDLTAERNP